MRALFFSSLVQSLRHPIAKAGRSNSVAQELADGDARPDAAGGLKDTCPIHEDEVRAIRDLHRGVKTHEAFQSEIPMSFENVVGLSAAGPGATLECSDRLSATACRDVPEKTGRRELTVKKPLLGLDPIPCPAAVEYNPGSQVGFGEGSLALRVGTDVLQISVPDGSQGIDWSRQLNNDWCSEIAFEPHARRVVDADAKRLCLLSGLKSNKSGNDWDSAAPIDGAAKKQPTEIRSVANPSMPERSGKVTSSSATDCSGRSTDASFSAPRLIRESEAEISQISESFTRHDTSNRTGLVDTAFKSGHCHSTGKVSVVGGSPGKSNLGGCRGDPKHRDQDGLHLTGRSPQDGSTVATTPTVSPLDSSHDGGCQLQSRYPSKYDACQRVRPCRVKPAAWVPRSPSVLRQEPSTPEFASSNLSRVDGAHDPGGGKARETPQNYARLSSSTSENGLNAKCACCEPFLGTLYSPSFYDRDLIEPSSFGSAQVSENPKDHSSPALSKSASCFCFSPGLLLNGSSADDGSTRARTSSPPVTPCLSPTPSRFSVSPSLTARTGVSPTGLVSPGGLLVEIPFGGQHFEEGCERQRGSGGREGLCRTRWMKSPDLTLLASKQQRKEKADECGEARSAQKSSQFSECQDRDTTCIFCSLRDDAPPAAPGAPAAPDTFSFAAGVPDSFKTTTVETSLRQVEEKEASGEMQQNQSCHLAAKVQETEKSTSLVASKACSLRRVGGPSRDDHDSPLFPGADDTYCERRESVAQFSKSALAATPAASSEAHFIAASDRPAFCTGTVHPDDSAANASLLTATAECARERAVLESSTKSTSSSFFPPRELKSQRQNGVSHVDALAENQTPGPCANNEEGTHQTQSMNTSQHGDHVSCSLTAGKLETPPEEKVAAICVLQDVGAALGCKSSELPSHRQDAKVVENSTVDNLVMQKSAEQPTPDSLFRASLVLERSSDFLHSSTSLPGPSEAPTALVEKQHEWEGNSGKVLMKGATSFCESQKAEAEEGRTSQRKPFTEKLFERTPVLRDCRDALDLLGRDEFSQCPQQNSTTRQGNSTIEKQSNGRKKSLNLQSPVPVWSESPKGALQVEVEINHFCSRVATPRMSQGSLIPGLAKLSLPPRGSDLDFSAWGYEHVSVLSSGSGGCVHLVRALWSPASLCSGGAEGRVLGTAWSPLSVLSPGRGEAASFQHKLSRGSPELHRAFCPDLGCKSPERSRDKVPPSFTPFRSSRASSRVSPRSIPSTAQPPTWQMILGTRRMTS